MSFGKLASQTSAKEGFIAAAKKAAAIQGQGAAPQSLRKQRDAAAATAPLMPENRLAWEVLVAMKDQVMPTFGAVVGFRFEALDFVFRTIVPRQRRREVFEKFQLLAPYALQSMNRGAGGRERHGKDTKDSSSRRRSR